MQEFPSAANQGSSRLIIIHMSKPEESQKNFLVSNKIAGNRILNLRRYWCVNSPLVMAPRKCEGLNPRLLNFSMVVDARLEELLMITILVPQAANFSTIPTHKCRHNKNHR